MPAYISFSKALAEGVGHDLHPSPLLAKSRLSRFVVRITRRWAIGKRRWVMQVSTDAKQIADLLCTGMVTETPLQPRPYFELRRLRGEFSRLGRSARA